MRVIVNGPSSLMKWRPWLVKKAKAMAAIIQEVGLPVAQHHTTLPGGARAHVVARADGNHWIMITGGGVVGGFLVLLLNNGTEGYEGWGYDDQGAPGKLVDIPQAGDEGYSSALIEYHRGPSLAAVYRWSYDVDEFGVETARSTRLMPPETLEAAPLHRFEYNSSPVQALTAGLRAYSGRLWLWGGGEEDNNGNPYGESRTWVMDYDDPPAFGSPPDHVLVMGLPANPGSSGGAGDARILPDQATVQLARADTTTGIGYQNYTIATGAASGAFEEFTPHTYTGGAAAVNARPIQQALGVESVFHPDVTTTLGSGARDFLALQVGAGVYYPPGTRFAHTATAQLGNPWPHTVEAFGNELFNDRYALSAYGVALSVSAWYAYVGGEDYWHVYTATTKATETLVGSTYEYDYPVVTNLAFYVMKSDGTIVHSSTQSWTQTAGDPSRVFSSTPGTFKFYTPHYAHDAWIVGEVTEFGPDTATTTISAMWNTDLSTVYTYSGYELLYVAADASGAYVILGEYDEIDLGEGPETVLVAIHTVPIGSAAAPSQLVHLIDDGDFTHQTPGLTTVADLFAPTGQFRL